MDESILEDDDFEAPNKEDSSIDEPLNSDDEPVIEEDCDLGEQEAGQEVLRQLQLDCEDLERASGKTKRENGALSIARKIYDRFITPSKKDVTWEFADSEVFLVDGDAVLHHVISRTVWPTDGGSSLHVIYLMENLLHQFISRGGKFVVVFFECGGHLWQTAALQLLRRVVVRHFTANTSLDVLQGFSSPAAADFAKFVAEQRPTFILTVEDTASHQGYFVLNFLLYKLMALTCLDVKDLTPDVSSLYGWLLHLHLDLSKFRGLIHESHAAVVSRLKVLEAQISQEHSVWNLQLQDPSPSSPPWHPFPRLLCHLQASGQKDYEAYLVVVQCLILADLVKKHVPLSHRIAVDEFYTVAKDSQLSTILSRLLYLKCGTVDVSGPGPALPDTIDTHLVLTMLFKYTSSIESASNLDDLVESELSHNKPIKDELLSKVQLLFKKTKINILDCPSSPVAVTLWSDVDVKKVEEVQFLRNEAKIMPIRSKLYSQYLSDVNTKDIQTLTEAEKEGFLKKHREFVERYHWHTLKELSDDFDRTYEVGHAVGFMAKQRRQKYASFVTRYGLSIEGNIATDKPIVVSEQKKKGEKKVKEKQSVTKLKVENIKAGFKKDKEKQKLSLKNAKESQSIEHALGALETNRKVYEEKLRPIAGFESDKSDIQNYFLQKKLELHIKLIRQVTKSFKIANPEEKVGLRIRVLQAVKQVRGHVHMLSAEDQAKLNKCLQDAHFPGVAHAIGLADNSRATDDAADFQLRHMGQLIELNLPKDKDPRIDNFIPDFWQRKLFDAIDQSNSALIVAPTSSGKTFASYYCMETILRETNEGVVIYVAPTKALVNQVSATIAARFSSRKKTPPGVSVLGTFTRDVRENVLNCQILVTVPQCLEILLLSPRRVRWVQNIRYVIFDEVHNIGAESGGEVWEHMFTLIRCPFLALSATIQNPRDLHGWLVQMEDFKREKDQALGTLRKSGSYHVNLVIYKERHTHLDNYVYSPHDDEGCLQKLHPLASLNLGKVKQARAIPSHISLSPVECLELYEALDVEFKEKAVFLSPASHFGSTILQRQDVQEYDQKLKDFFVQALADSASGQAKCHSVLERLTPSSRFSHEDREMTREKVYLADKIPSFMLHLKNNNMLPAIVFSFNRSYCKAFAALTTNLCHKQIEKAKNTKKYQKRPAQSIEHKDEETHSRKRQKESERGSEQAEDVDFLGMLTHVHRDFPTLTFVGQHDLGDQDAKFILERISGAGSIYNLCLRYGISWHHAGNSRDMKESAEMLFRNKFVSLCFSTTTLAQGIHMPCKTVVFAGNSIYLSSLNFHQCSGRAGRRGLDPEGNVVFIGVPSSKIKRLTTAQLPMLRGNKPLSVTLVLRLFIMTSDRVVGVNEKVDKMSLEGRTNDMVSRALCLLEQSYFLAQHSNFRSQLKHYFMYSTEFLVRHGLLDTDGRPVGFAGLASHLFYHEPNNFAFCHLLEDGVFHDICRLNKFGEVDSESLQSLMVILSHLLTDVRLHESVAERRKLVQMNSLVQLPPLPEAARRSLVAFNGSLKKTFEDYLKAAVAATTGEQSNVLPISEVSYEQGSVTAGGSSVLSTFALLSGLREKDVDLHNEVATATSQLKKGLLSQNVPKIDLSVVKNSFALDFFNNGSHKELVMYNEMDEGEVYNYLYDFECVLQVISTSLREMGSDSVDDVVITAFQTLADQFSIKFNKDFGKRAKAKIQFGSVRQHKTGCSACSILQEGKNINSTKFDRQFKIRGRMTCSTRFVVYVLTCYTCRQQLLGESVAPLSETFPNLQENNPKVSSHLKKNHQVSLCLVSGASNHEALTRERIVWMSKLVADYIQN